MVNETSQLHGHGYTQPPDNVISEKLRATRATSLHLSVELKDESQRSSHPNVSFSSCPPARRIDSW